MKKLFIIHILLAMPLLAWCDNITFADAEVKAICVKNWDTNYDGELSFEEAEMVSELRNYFEFNSRIKSFDELQYFTNVTSIFQTFQCCTNLSSIILPRNLHYIFGGVFNGCSSLTSVTIPNSVTLIGKSTFRDCSSLASVTIPNSVTEIEREAFFGCSSLTSVTVPNSVTSIGGGIFSNCI